MSPPSKSSAVATLREELQPLVEQLASLPANERAQVMRAARARAKGSELPIVPWDEFKKLKGIVRLGGNAVEDCEALYDDA